MRRLLSITTIFSILLFSCSKKDTTAGNNGESNFSIVHNVQKESIIKLVNDVRQAGCVCGTTSMPPVGPISWNDQLATAAYDHSVDMEKNNYFSHTGLNGSNPGQRITAAGYNWSTYGENIAYGYPTEQDVIEGWLKSEGHCKNIMDSHFKEMGVGREVSKWTQAFGTK